MPVFTYQTRLVLEAAQDAALNAYAKQYGQLERKLFAAMVKNTSLAACHRKDEVVSIAQLKSRFIADYGITARHFNAIRMLLEGKIESIKSRQGDLIHEAQGKIKRLTSTLVRLDKELKVLRKPKKKMTTVDPVKIDKLAFSLHQKKRSLARQQARLERMITEKACGKVRLCFGSRKRFRSQFNDAQLTHADWKKDWQTSRSDQFFLVGSKDETAGCQSCVATVQADQRLRLRVRLPEALGKYITLTDVQFAYGHPSILNSLVAGRALSYRFIRDDQGWRVFVSTQHDDVPIVTKRGLGAFGLDLNADHLALAELDRFGNLTNTQRLQCATYGLSTDQAKAKIGDLAKAVAAQCAAAGKPLVLEKLDFRQKKSDLTMMNPKAARLLSGFFYAQVGAALRSACFRAGVEVIDVNPAYTSVIGAVNHASVRGISVHQGAATAIARRGLGFSERLSTRAGVAPTRGGGHVTFALPARNRAKHVWSFWAGVRKNLSAAHAAHVRSGDHKQSPAPVISAKQCVATRKGLAHSLSPTRTLTVRPRHASHPHCGSDGLEDVPF
ncbi:hypothetical protein P5704_025435 (plasmid) [Pseudomonas sp. FeN3W]|nr:hypothetical protein P5704_025435 [Pseudomonas sp. FeN3W]